MVSHTVGFVGRFKASRHVPLTLGRSRTNRVVLTDLAVSKEHAQVLFSEGAGFVVADDGRYVGGGSSVTEVRWPYLVSVVSCAKQQLPAVPATTARLSMRYGSASRKSPAAGSLFTKAPPFKSGRL